MKKKNKIVLISAAVLIAAAVLIFFAWTRQTYKPTAQLKELVTAEDYTMKNNWYVFEPANDSKKGRGIIIYPGAKVEPIAYGYLGKQLAQDGYLVVIPNMLLNLAIADVNVADEIMEQFNEVEQWVIGGHSLGGVAAASFAANHPEGINGLILLASYPSDSVNFSMNNLPILSIYAQNDLVSPPENVLEKQNLLSSNTVLHEIQGGNHAGFGMYGKQSDDGKATISPLEQQNRILNQMCQWLVTAYTN